MKELALLQGTFLILQNKLNLLKEEKVSEDLNVFNLPLPCSQDLPRTSCDLEGPGLAECPGYKSS